MSDLVNEMIARVAFATCSCEPCICKHRAGFEGMPCLERGRKGIEAMREPTPKMLAAADASTPSGFHWGIKDSDLHGGRVIYKAMISEALK